jgi:NADH:quinone reductase (non-electrogenic)
VRRVASDTVVWTAGVAANPVVAQLGLPVDERGRVRVDEMMRVVDVPGVWSLGDCAAVPNEATPGEFDPPTCQHALRQARRLARNLRGTPKAYAFKTKGQMATLGRRHGIAVVGRMHVRGVVGWTFARGYHLLALPFTSRRIRVMADWLAAACFRRDVTALSLNPEPEPA